MPTIQTGTSKIYPNVFRSIRFTSASVIPLSLDDPLNMQKKITVVKK